MNNQRAKILNWMIQLFKFKNVPVWSVMIRTKLAVGDAKLFRASWILSLAIIIAIPMAAYLINSLTRLESTTRTVLKSRLKLNIPTPPSEPQPSNLMQTINGLPRVANNKLSLEKNQNSTSRQLPLLPILQYLLSANQVNTFNKESVQESQLKNIQFNPQFNYSIPKSPPSNSA